MEGGAAAARRRIRRDGRDADVDAAISAATCGVSVGAWPPRDGPETAPISRASLREMQQLWRPRPTAVARDRRGAIQLNAGGYGFGLGIYADLRLRPHRRAQRRAAGIRIADALAAGLRRRPHRVSATSPTRAGAACSRQAFDAAGARPARCSRACRSHRRRSCEAREAVSRLVVRWDDRLADQRRGRSISFSIDRRTAAAREIEALRAKVGACTPADGSTRRERLARPVDDELRARQAEVAITLAPTMPPRVQAWTVRAGEGARLASACSQ